MGAGQGKPGLPPFLFFIATKGGKPYEYATTDVSQADDQLVASASCQHHRMGGIFYGRSSQDGSLTTKRYPRWEF
jgi:hypothetical protein